MRKLQREETLKERRIRWLLLLITLSITMFAFYIQSLKFARQAVITPLVAVVQKITDNNNPIVAVAELRGGKPFLHLYEVEVNDQYRFELINKIELEQFPTGISSVENKGVWLQLKGEWWFYNIQLQKSSKPSTEPIHTQTPITFDITKEKDFVVTTVHVNNKPIWSHSFPTEPLSIHSLSEKNNIWLLVFQDEIVIYENE